MLEPELQSFADRPAQATPLAPVLVDYPSLELALKLVRNLYVYPSHLKTPTCSYTKVLKYPPLHIYTRVFKHLGV